MKLKNKYRILNVAGSYCAIPEEEMNGFHGFIRLNETGVFMMRLLEEDISKVALIEVLVKKYEIDIATAEKEIDFFLSKLRSKDLLME